MRQDFEENESYEALVWDITTGRREFASLNKPTQKHLREYQERKRAHNDAQREEFERETAAQWAARGPQVRRLRHALLKPEQFAVGTRIGELLADTNAARGPHEAAQAELADVRARLAAAEREVEQHNPETAATPGAFVNAAATVEFYRKKLRPASTRAAQARERFEFAEAELRREYAEYSHAVSALNGIGDERRPLDAGETLEQRAREVGEVARLQFLLAAMLAPRPAQPHKLISAA